MAKRPQKTDKQLLDDYKRKRCNKHVVEYYEGDNIWRTLRIEREEERHSAFIAWVLKQDWDKEDAPIKHLLKKLGLLSPITIKNESSYIECEKTLGELSDIYQKDELDIYAWIETDKGRIELVIENKIDSPEVPPKKNDPDKRFQTQRYYEALKNYRKTNLPKPDKQFFIFLSPYDYLKPIDKTFRKNTYTYQILIVPIFEKYLEKVSNTVIASKIKEYLRNLSNNHKNKPAIAMPTEEKNILDSFFDDNKEIFIRALGVKIEGMKDGSEKANLQAVLDALNVSNSRQYNFTVSGYSGKFGMYDVVGLFTAKRLEELMRKGKKDIEAIEEINCEINRYIYKRSGQRVNISFKPNQVEYSTRDGKKQEIEYIDKEHNRTIYITNQWSFSGSNANFKRFMDKVNKNYYPDFVIQEK